MIYLIVPHGSNDIPLKMLGPSVVENFINFDLPVNVLKFSLFYKFYLTYLCLQ